MATLSPAPGSGCKTAIVDDTTGNVQRCDRATVALWMCDPHYRRARRAARAYIKANGLLDKRPIRRRYIEIWLDNHRALKPGGVLPFAPVEDVREYDRQTPIPAALPVAA